MIKQCIDCGLDKLIRSGHRCNQCVHKRRYIPRDKIKRTQCVKCKSHRTLNDVRCLACQRIKNQNYYKLNKVELNLKKAEYHRFIYSRWTDKEFNQALIEQDNKCALCDIEFIDGIMKCADHNHYNGEKRGILCNRCNRGLGLIGDTLTNAKRLVRYLELYE